MKTERALLCALCAIGSLATPSGAYTVDGRAVDSSQIKRLFAKPTREYSTAPLWVWNDRLTDKEVVDTLRDLAGQQVKQVFVHPRPGLMTPYLSAEWFRLWKVALAEAQRLDMNLWIYDENSYPSGFAGGWVPEVMPESRGRGLIFREVKTPPASAQTCWPYSGWRNRPLRTSRRKFGLASHCPMARIWWPRSTERGTRRGLVAGATWTCSTRE